MTPRLLQINRQLLPDGRTEFEICAAGVIQKCVLDYGDGAREELVLPAGTRDPVMYCEHAFARGRQYSVRVALVQNNAVCARRTLILTCP